MHSQLIGMCAGFLASPPSLQELCCSKMSPDGKRLAKGPLVSSKTSVSYAKSQFMMEERVIGPLHQDKKQPDRQKGKNTDLIKSQGL